MTYDAIYLSPHLDDAALSCGGQIFEQTAVGKRVLVVTVMAAQPSAQPLSDFAQTLHGRWQLAQHAVQARQAEDVAACAILGADYQHGFVPDCIYRNDAHGRALYPDWPHIIDGIHPDERPLLAQLAAWFNQLPASPMVVAPLAIGNHVDHQIVRQAAHACFGARLWYYEDYPYTRDAAAVTAVFSATDMPWHSQTIPLSAAAIEAKINAIRAYRSQLSSFYADDMALQSEITEMATAVGGERLWQYQAS